MSRPTGNDNLLWLILLTGPVVWLFSFAADFALSGWTCSWASKLPQFIVNAAALAITGLTAVAAFGQWRAMGKGWPGEAGGVIARTRAMAIGGIALNAMFFLVVVGQTLPLLVLAGCE